MKRTIFSLLLGGLLCCPSLSGQVSLRECRAKAQANYPLVKQYHLLELAEHYDLSNAAKGNLPQLSISGKVSHQSDVTSLPFSLPGIDFRGLPKDQYQVVAEVRQNVWDGGKIYSQKKQTQAATEESRRQMDVTMYRLNEQVDQLYFGILLQTEQLKQNTLLQEELARNQKQIASYVKNGIANEADMDAVRMEILQTRQQRITLEANRKAYQRMLALLVGEELTENITLEKPEVPLVNGHIERPELYWYEAQLHRVDIQEQALKVGYRPNLSLFVQGGAGNPGLNILKDSFEPYYLIGARLTWNFGSLYTLKNDRHKLDTRRKAIASDREVFLLNTRIQLSEQEEAANALHRQMQEDDELIRLRTNVRKAAEAKVAGGTLCVTEMLRELTNESLAKQDKATHEIEWLMRMYRQEYLVHPSSGNHP